VELFEFQATMIHSELLNLENYRDRSLTNKPLETAQTPLESQL
jgi:hypothetical protein